MVGGIPDVLGRFSALGFESFKPSESEFPLGQDSVLALYTQLLRSPSVSVFEIGWSDIPSTRFSCVFDHSDQSLYMSLEQCLDESSPIRGMLSPAGTLTKASSFANSNSDSEDSPSVSDFEVEEDDLHAEIARVIAVALVDIAESLEAQKMYCLLDIGHPIFNPMMRTLLSAGFVVRSRSSKLTPMRRQQLLTFSIDQEQGQISSPQRAAANWELEGVALPPSVFDPLGEE